MKSNFRGSKIVEVKRDERRLILDKLQNAASFGLLEACRALMRKTKTFREPTA